MEHFLSSVSGNTTNFQAHLDGEHKLSNPASQAATQSTALNTRPTLTQLTMTFSNDNAQGKLGNLGPDKRKRIDETLLKLTVGKALPPSLVDNKFFKDFVAALEPSYLTINSINNMIFI